MKQWFHPEARIELLESIAYYDHHQMGLGQRLLDGIVEALHRISNYPKMYRKVAGDWRQCRIPHFPYGLIYRVKNQRIEIIAVMQLNKEPGYWRERAV